MVGDGGVAAGGPVALVDRHAQMVVIDLHHAVVVQHLHPHAFQPPRDAVVVPVLA